MIKKLLLAVCALALGTGLVAATTARADGSRHPHDPFAGESLYRDVAFYSALGEHRTATATDYLTHTWLALRLKALGFKTELFPFETRQFYPTKTQVTVGGKNRLEAFPVWHPTPTRPGGLSAKLTTDIANVSGKIYLFDNPSGTVNQAVQSTIKTAAANGASGVIVVLSQSASLEIYGQNAQQLLSYAPGSDPGAGDQTPWPVPVVTVGRKDRPALQQAIDGSLDVKVVSEGVVREHARSYVLLGTLERGPADKTLLVSTPVSGWFRNAGERGTGVAAWLALAEWAAKETSEVRWVFLASSGHELNFLGTHEYLQSDRIPPPDDVYLWTHLGANLITYEYLQNPDGTHTRTNQPPRQSIKYISDNASIVDALNAAFVPENNPQAAALNITGLQNSIGGGDLFYAKYFGYSQLLYFAGGNAKFHTREDTPETTGPELLEPIARLIKSAFEQIVDDL